MAATAYFNKFPSYCRMVAHAKSLANRSLLIDHCGLEHIDLTSGLTNVEHVYSIEKENRRGFSKLTLIEFKSWEDAERVAKNAIHNSGLLPVPLKILRYNANMSTITAGPDTVMQDQSQPFRTDQIRLTLDRELSPSFKTYGQLVSNNLMSLVELKLRFITLVNFERILCSGIFERYELMPFGSSVIDTGCDTGDLDLIFVRQIDHYKAIHDNRSERKNDPIRHGQQAPQVASNLIHLDKGLYNESKDRNGPRGIMGWFDNILRDYMPLTDGYSVLSIHRAKVPIIKFTSRITNTDCDLSFDLGLEHRGGVSDQLPVNQSIVVTEILYWLCRNNNIITTLIIYLRTFAKLSSITSKMPGSGMTNFQLLSLIIFFLQQNSIVNTQSLENATSQDVQKLKEKIMRSSKRKDNQPSWSTTRDGKFVVAPALEGPFEPLVPPFRRLLDGSLLQESHHRVYFDDDELDQIMPLLIRQFFRFYSNFAFVDCSINLYESRKERKLDNSMIFVLNPIDRTRNICHNVNRKALETFVKAMRAAAHELRYDDSPLCCPLMLLQAMLKKHLKQAKKNISTARRLEDDIEYIHPVSAGKMVEDACR